jgi:hypothetical protein
MPEPRPVRSPRDLPIAPYYLLIQFKTESVFIPGDERSRNSPGHGYPDDTMVFETPKMLVFDSFDGILDAMTELYRKTPGRTDVAAFKVSASLDMVQSFRVQVSET